MPRKPPLFAVLSLLAILAFACSARAASVPLLGSLPLPATATIGDESEEAEAAGAEDEEEVVEVCEEDEEAGEECEAEAAADAPEACTLKSAEASVSAQPAHNRVGLTLRYVAVAPAMVNVQYSLRGHKGGLRLGNERRRFSRKGVFHDTERLSDSEMSKVRAATELDVRVHAVNTPRYCHRLLDTQLTVRHNEHGNLTWSSGQISPR